MNQEKEVIVAVNRSKMPIFTCSCGKQILIVPDMKEMNRAIEAHVAEHKRMKGQRLTEDELTDEILAALSQNYF
ncbi:MAG TPA: hypothetical protein VLH35_07240 [Candidatus Acidoferrales bacterium]|nr:hypothetical protein [Candidatus Acidoferrales bacterium]